MIFLLYLKCIACKCAAASICRLESCVKDFLGLFEMAIDSHFLLHWFQYMFFFQLELSSQFEEMDRTESISPSGLFLYFMWDTLWIFSYLSFFKIFFSVSICLLTICFSLTHIACKVEKCIISLFHSVPSWQHCVCVYSIYTVFKIHHPVPLHPQAEVIPFVADI